LFTLVADDSPESASGGNHGRDRTLFVRRRPRPHAGVYHPLW